MDPMILVVQPDPDVPLDRFGDWLTEAGVRYCVVAPGSGTDLSALDGFAGLIVLGGIMSSLDDAAWPWLEDIRELLRRSAARAIPSLGICLGAQLTAQAFGGEVEVGAHGVEAGVVQIDWTAAAAGDPLVGGLPAPIHVPSMHGDVVRRLPPAAVLLGGSGMYPHQAFRVGASAWAVQFHPEVSPATYDRWVALGSAAEPALAQRLAEQGRTVTEQDRLCYASSRALASAFARMVAAAAFDRA